MRIELTAEEVGFIRGEILSTVNSIIVPDVIRKYETDSDFYVTEFTEEFWKEMDWSELTGNGWTKEECEAVVSLWKKLYGDTK